MRKGWRKYPYNRVAFGEQVKRCREAQGWSYRGLIAQISELWEAHPPYRGESGLLNTGTLRQVETGDRSLPVAHRLTLIEILSDTENRKPLTITRKTFLALAGLAVGELIISNVSDRDAPLAVACSTDEPASRRDDGKTEDVELDPGQLGETGRWEEGRLIWLARATAARSREEWPNWAKSLMDAGLMSLTLGRLEESASCLDAVLRAPADVAHALDPTIFAEAHRRRGWLDLELHRFGPAIAHLNADRAILRQRDPTAEGSLHFLGKTYCAWGIAENNPAYRAQGIALFQRAFDEGKRLGNSNSMGYDALQQVACLVYDDNLRDAQRRTREGYELLGTRSTGAGHHQMNRGRLEYYRNRKKALEHFQTAHLAYSTDIFYAKGLASSLVMLGGLYTDKTATLPQAAAYALVAACAHPYRQRLDFLESVATQVYYRVCDRLVSKFDAFWRDLKERVWRMDTDPFSSLAALMRERDGPARLRNAMTQTQASIKRGLPDGLAHDVAL